MDFPVTINSQEEFDRQIEDRLKRARNQWERESGISEALRERDEARTATTQAESDAFDRLLRRDARDALVGMNVKDPKRQQLIMKLADLSSVEAGPDGEPNKKAITDALKALHKDTPEVFGEGATVADAAPDGDAGGDENAPLTEASVAAMSPEEVNSNWDRVKAFLAGERR